MSRSDAAALLLYVCIAVSLGFVDHRVRREQFRAHVLTDYIPSVVDGTSGAPAKYRVLMPYGLSVLVRHSPADPYITFLAVEFVSILAALTIVHAYLREWYSPGAALSGTMGLAALTPLTFTNTWAHPDTFPDLALFALGCMAVARRQDVLFGVVLLVGMFNRETTGFLLLLWASYRRYDRNPRDAARFLVYLALAVGVYAGLRWVRGFEHYRMFMLGENLRMLRPLPAGFDPYTRVFGYFWLVLMGIPGWLAYQGAGRPGAPLFHRAALPVAALYLLVAWLFAAIAETRVLLPILCLLLPSAVGFFAPVQPSAGPVEQHG